jgi:uncharacterized protein
VLRQPSHDDQTGIMALNNAFAAETSLLTPASLAALVAAAWHVRVCGAADAFCIALDQDAAYDNANFCWFAARFQHFVYVDRIVVGNHARGRGLARALYDDLAVTAKAAGHTLIGCEVNLDPPNPASDRFHATYGFVEAGTARLASRNKTVRYLTLQI